jgi:outer membrane protein assembly factor BamB
MYYRLILLLLLLPLNYTHAQFLINESYDIGGEDINDIAYFLQADEYGYTLDITTSFSGTDLSSGGLIRTNTEGDSLWSALFDAFPAAFFTSCFLKDSTSGHYFVAGSEYIPEDITYSPYLMRLDGHGNQQWITYYNDPNKDVVPDIAQAPDGNLITYNLGGVFGQYSEIIVQKLDKNDGSVIWEQTVETGVLFPSSGKMVVIPDGHIMLAFYYPTPPPNRRGYAVSRLDPQGNTLWTKYYEEEDTESFPAYIEAHPDGGVVTCWGKDTLILDEGINGQSTLIKKLDENGALEWEYFIYKGYAGDVYAMEVTENGDIVLTGYARSPELGGERYSWLVRLNAAGEKLWERVYLSPTTYHSMSGFRDVVETPDGCLAMCGGIRDTVPGEEYISNYNIWLVKVGADGCVTPGCQDTLIYLTPTREAPGAPLGMQEVFFKAFPNPTAGPIQLSFYNPVRYPQPRLRVLDSQGRTVHIMLLQKGVQQAELSLAGLPGGLYWLQYESAGQLLQSVSIVKK